MFLGEATGVLVIVFGDGINVCGLVDLELLLDVHLSPVYGPIIIRKKKRDVIIMYISIISTHRSLELMGEGREIENNVRWFNLKTRVRRFT